MARKIREKIFSGLILVLFCDNIIKMKNHVLIKEENMAIHNEAKKGEIAKIVLMPGDPLRAKYIAEHYLEDAKLVNQTRNMFGFTGTYHGKEVTVMASGMGMPSMGIYAYELYQFYEVETIIRIGSCGSYVENLNLLDIVLVHESYTTGNFAENMSGEKCDTVKASTSINRTIKEVAKQQNIPCIETNVACTECFDSYMIHPEDYVKNLPKEKQISCSEMEAFALFYTAKMLHKKAACLLTVVDSNCKKEVLSAEAREKSLQDMIKLALESACQIK